MTAQIDSDTRRLNAFTGLAARGCRLDGDRKRIGMDAVLTEMSAAFDDLPPDVVEDLCHRWLEGPDGEWFPSEHALRRLAPNHQVAVRSVQANEPWQHDAEDAVGKLANVFLRRIGQLEPADHQRFGRELAAWLPTNRSGSRGIEQWVSKWLGADWWQLMGPKPEPFKAKAGGTWKGMK